MEKGGETAHSSVHITELVADEMQITQSAGTGPGKRRRAETSATPSDSSEEETPIGTRYETQMEDLPGDILEIFVECMVPLTRLCFQTAAKRFRSTVKGYRTHRASEPWILMTLITPERVHSSDRAQWKDAPYSRLCWALEPRVMKWCPLTLPFMDGTNSLYCRWPVIVHSAGSSGLLVVRHLFNAEIVVGNPMTQEWHKVADSPSRLMEDKYRGLQRGDEFAVHLVVAARQKETPLKLVIFWRHQDRRNTDDVTISALQYCFSCKEWGSRKDVARITIGTPSYAYAVTMVYDRVCAHGDTEAGVVFILVSQVHDLGYLVVGYSVALNEFTIAVPWSHVEGFTCSRKNVVLAFDFGPDRVATGTSMRRRRCSCGRSAGAAGSAGAQTIEVRSEEYYQRKRGFEYRGAIMDDGPAAWMEGLAQGLQLLVARTPRGQGVEIRVLRNDPDAKKWKPVVPPVQPDAASQSRAKELAKSARLRLQTVVSPATRLSGPPTFQLAPSGPHSVFVAARSNVNSYCTQVGIYDMDTGDLRIVPTPELPMDLHCQDKPGPFWSKFIMDSFHPNLTQGSFMLG